MKTQTALESKFEPTRRRLGRPPSKIMKVTISVRIPAQLDAFLNDYSDEHGVPKGDLITQAVMLFQLKNAADPAPQARALGA